MVKVYRDLGEMESRVDYKGEYADLMKQIPNFDKSEGARKVYQKKEYSVYKVDNGFIVHNTRVEFEKAHTHLKSFEMCKVLIDCCISKRLPKTRNHYILQSAIRISIDKKYIEEVKQLIEVRENKSLNKYIIKR